MLFRSTGLQIRDRLANRADLEVLSIDPARRKDADARAELLNAADAVVLCLPDDASREAVSMITSNRVKVVDASTAFRTAAGWSYGFPEMSRDQRAAIKASNRVSNPGCYPTGFIALVRPLVAAGLIPADFPLTGGTTTDLFTWPSVKDDRNVHGPLSIAVPGHVDGHATALANFGTKSFAEVIAPAIELADAGIAID